MADATTAPVAAPTLGQGIDAKVTWLEARIAVLEADAKTDWGKLVAWLKVQWPHFITWGGTAWLVIKNGLHFL